MSEKSKTVACGNGIFGSAAATEYPNLLKVQVQTGKINQRGSNLIAMTKTFFPEWGHMEHFSQFETY